ncbi:MAG: hypothetical protein Q7J72_01280 [Candidatus Omnitrophota bacterium]|nr:hypothetical protein [Candidatus Omnitrophota bacterium]
MANTTGLKNPVEQYVRDWCSRSFGVAVEDSEKEIRLVTGGVHRFDVVAKDRSLVAGIKTSSLRDNGRVGTGTIKSTYTEIYFLSIVKADKKLMILTDKRYCDYFQGKSKGKIVQDVEIIYCPLPKRLAEEVAAVHKECRKEIGKRNR